MLLDFALAWPFLPWISVSSYLFSSLLCHAIYFYCIFWCHASQIWFVCMHHTFLDLQRRYVSEPCIYQSSLRDLDSSNTLDMDCWQGWSGVRAILIFFMSVSPYFIILNYWWKLHKVHRLTGSVLFQTAITAECVLCSEETDVGRFSHICDKWLLLAANKMEGMSKPGLCETDVLVRAINSLLPHLISSSSLLAQS